MERNRNNLKYVPGMNTRSEKTAKGKKKGTKQYW